MYRVLTPILFLILISLFFVSACSRSGSSDRPEGSIVVNEVSTQESTASSDSREAWQKPSLIMNKMGNLSDRVIADIGAGTGYFAFRLLAQAKKVIAIEIDQEMIELMNSLAVTIPDASRQKFETRLSKPDDPNLKPGEVDDILIVNVIGYIEDRATYLSKCKEALSANGVIHIVDYKVKRLPIEAPDYSNRVYIHLLEEELEATGFTNITTDDTSLEYQYIIQASLE